MLLAETFLGIDVSAWSALGGAIVGGVLTCGGNIFVERHKLANEKKALTAGLIAEIESLVTVLKAREYLPALRGFADALRKYPSIPHKMDIKVHASHLPFFEANLQNLGKVDADLLIKVMHFSSALKAVTLDITNGGMLTKDCYCPKLFDETADMADFLFQTADAIVKEHKETRRC